MSLELIDDPGNIICLLIGARKTGKTPYFLGDEDVPLEGLIPSYVAKDMKVLFADTLYHNSYNHIKIIKPEEITLGWKKGVRRVIVLPEEMEKTLKIIRDNFWNGVIVFEDAFKHQRKQLTPACAAIIGNSKQQNVDVFFMYHSWKFVPLDLYVYLDYIEMFKVNKPPGKREEEELADNFEKVVEAYNRVKAHPSRFHHETVHVTQ